MLPNNDPTRKIERGYPNLDIIKQSIKALYKHLPNQRIEEFKNSIEPNAISIDYADDITIAVHKLASKIAQHLHLPVGSILVNFRISLQYAGQVELTDQNDYLIDLHERYREDQRDIAAILAHEITHVFLHRTKLGFPTTQDNEILTDTAAVYLGVGWTCLNSFRIMVEDLPITGVVGSTNMTIMQASKVGYLTPEEFGYVLAKRSLVFKEKIDRWLTLQAREMYQVGLRMAMADYRCPPLRSCGLWRRMLYYWYRWRVSRLGIRGSSVTFKGYQLEVSGSTIKVRFDCPVCFQKLRVPAYKGAIKVECSVCKTTLDCRT